MLIDNKNLKDFKYYKELVITLKLISNMKKTMVEHITDHKYYEKCGVRINEVDLDGFIVINNHRTKKYLPSLYRHIKRDLWRDSHTEYVLISKGWTLTDIDGSPSIKTTNFLDMSELYSILARQIYCKRKRSEIWNRYRKLIIDHGKN